MLELCVVRWSDLFHRGNQIFDQDEVRSQVVLPGWQVHVGEADLHLFPDREFIEAG